MTAYTDVHARRFELTRAHIPAGPGDCLEVGWCGHLDGELSAKGWRVHGANWTPGTPTTDTNFNAEQPWPLGDEQFDLVIACEILEHLPDDPMALLAEANRVLRPGGHILLTTPNICSARGVRAMLHGFQPYLFCTFPRTPCDRHVIEYDKRMLELMLHSAGFEPRVWTENCWSEPPEETLQLLRERGFPVSDRGDNLFTFSRKIRGVRNRRPDGIYHG